MVKIATVLIYSYTLPSKEFLLGLVCTRFICASSKLKCMNVHSKDQDVSLVYTRACCENNWKILSDSKAKKARLLKGLEQVSDPWSNNFWFSWTRKEVSKPGNDLKCDT